MGEVSWEASVGVAAVSVLANDRGQVLLLREGGWGSAPPGRLLARPAAGGAGVELLAEDRAVGLAPAPALAALSAARACFLGGVESGRAVCGPRVALRVDPRGRA